MSADDFRGLTADERAMLSRANAPTGRREECSDAEHDAICALLEQGRIYVLEQFSPDIGIFLTPRPTEQGRKALRVDALLPEEFRA